MKCEWTFTIVVAFSFTFFPVSADTQNPPQIEWDTKTFGPLTFSTAEGVIQALDGGYFVCGTTSNDYDYTWSVMYIVKLDGNGEKVRLLTYEWVTGAPSSCGAGKEGCGEPCAGASGAGSPSASGAKLSRAYGRVLSAGPSWA